MTINIYPAFLKDNVFTHADNWDEDSTLNIANSNFYAFFDELMKYHHGAGVPEAPAYLYVKDVFNALKDNREVGIRFPHYTEKLKKIVARAQVLNVRYISYA